MHLQYGKKIFRKNKDIATFLKNNFGFVKNLPKVDKTITSETMPLTRKGSKSSKSNFSNIVIPFYFSPEKR